MGTRTGIRVEPSLRITAVKAAPIKTARTAATATAGHDSKNHAVIHSCN